LSIIRFPLSIVHFPLQNNLLLIFVVLNSRTLNFEKNMKKAFLLIPLALICVFVLTTQSCYYDNEEFLYGTGGSTATCDTTTAKFAAFASPLIVSKCGTSGCHNAATASSGANLSTYTSIKAYITANKAAFLGSINHSNAFSNMPKGGAKLAACDIKKLEVWINAGMQNN
jgi:hypothetical protein